MGNQPETHEVEIAQVFLLLRTSVSHHIAKVIDSLWVLAVNTGQFVLINNDCASHRIGGLLVPFLPLVKGKAIK